MQTIYMQNFSSIDSIRDLSSEELDLIGGADWGWGNFIGSVVGGAAGGAVVGSMAGGVGAGPGALTGAVGGAVTYVVYEGTISAYDFLTRGSPD